MKTTRTITLYPPCGQPLYYELKTTLNTYTDRRLISFTTDDGENIHTTLPYIYCEKDVL